MAEARTTTAAWIYDRAAYCRDGVGYNVGSRRSPRLRSVGASGSCDWPPSRGDWDTSAGSNSLPQNRQTTAAALMVSAHLGQIFSAGAGPPLGGSVVGANGLLLGRGASISSSLILGSAATTMSTRGLNMKVRMPQPKADLFFVAATIPAITAKTIKMKNQTIKPPAATGSIRHLNRNTNVVNQRDPNVRCEEGKIWLGWRR